MGGHFGGAPLGQSMLVSAHTHHASSLIQYKIHILSLAGDLQGTFSPSPDPGFGVRSVAWHPSGMFLAVSGWDDRVGDTHHLINTCCLSHSGTYTRQSDMVCHVHPRAIQSNYDRSSASHVRPRDIINQPDRHSGGSLPIGWSRRKAEDSSLVGTLSAYLAVTLNDHCPDERLDGPQTISLIKPDLSKPNPRSGAVQLEWNKTGTLLLVRYGNDDGRLYGAKC